MIIIGFFSKQRRTKGKAGRKVYLGTAVTQDSKSEPNNPLRLHFLDLLNQSFAGPKSLKQNSINAFFFNSLIFLDRNKNHTTSIFRLIKGVVYTEQSDD